jgi:hypothetical protein
MVKTCIEEFEERCTQAMKRAERKKRTLHVIDHRDAEDVISEKASR